ncbi:hypothetical protein [Kerstersia gyiorum]|uniref:hypothetical protein n=1 Tax=Kerstersia gyiorum TaxID=206506 RepID=UPI001290053E|nr:hypothetical protein [Kerstersia gyiorum]
MSKSVGYGLIAVSLIIFFAVSLHLTGYLILAIALAVAGLWMIWKSGANLRISSIVIVVAAILRFFYWNNFLGIFSSLGIAPSIYYDADYSPVMYFVYACVGLIGIVFCFIKNK